MLNESLYNYINKFTLETLRLVYIYDELIQSTFHNGLQERPLYNELVHHPSISSHEMLKVVCTFVVTEDSTRRKTEEEANLRKALEVKPREERNQNVSDRINKGQIEPNVNLSQLSQLNKSRT